ncbi:MAG: ATP-binding cassette domain-containing protein [Alphaproteobacteria bacterium]|nr:ATP-binding cassette domain-containing protein [Alphaproteobacteria bacterium]
MNDAANPVMNAAIEMRGVSKRFDIQTGVVHALRETDLDIAPGEIVGLLGFSGAGKSTLLRLMNVLETPSSGTVRIGGRDLTGLNDAELRAARRKIGMIFQQFNLLSHDTALENVAFALRIAGVGKTERDKRAREALDIVGLSDKAGSYPAQLSGGQRQRVAIARALVNEPGVLLCDEATSALDPHTSLSILRFLKDLNKKRGTTIVVVTHDIKVASYICSRCAIMQDGQIIEWIDMADPKPESSLGRFFMETAKGWSDDTVLPEENA